MTPTRFYVSFALIGLILPWIPYVLFLRSEGVNLLLFVDQVFANLPSTGFALDVLLSTSLFWIWSYDDARRHGIAHWWVVLLSGLTLGLSVAMPLYFVFRLRATTAATRP